MNVEDGAARLDVRDVDEYHGDAAQVSGRRADVGRQGLRGEHLLEEGTLGGDVPAEIERGVAEDLVDHVALLGGHCRSFHRCGGGGGGPRGRGRGAAMPPPRSNGASRRIWSIMSRCWAVIAVPFIVAGAGRVPRVAGPRTRFRLLLI